MWEPPPRDPGATRTTQELPHLHSRCACVSDTESPEARDPGDQEGSWKGLPPGWVLVWATTSPQPSLPQTNRRSLRLGSPRKDLRAPPSTKVTWSCGTLGGGGRCPRCWVQVPPPQVCEIPCYVARRGWRAARGSRRTLHTEPPRDPVWPLLLGIRAPRGHDHTRPHQRWRTHVPGSVTHASSNVDAIQVTIWGPTNKR